VGAELLVRKRNGADGDQRLDKLRRAGNQPVFPVNDAIHVNQVSCFHWVKKEQFLNQAALLIAARP
jgi:hypothetical protein